ncbi:MAG: IS982 family transposase, partial [Bacteroidaceae bacterium]|nr:IS982 family transposase [Bacteroidaceae bacterium]
MITDDKVTEIFCATDEFCKEFERQIGKKTFISSDGKVRRNRKASLSDSEIMTILIMFHFGSFRNFKHYYLFFIKGHL